MRELKQQRDAHKRWSYWKSAVRILGFALLIAAEVLGVFEEKDA